MSSPSYQHTVSAVGTPIPSELAVARVCAVARPNPAWRSVMLKVEVNTNLGKDSSQVFSGNVFYGKIISSHCENILSSLVRAARTFVASVWPVLRLGIIPQVRALMGEMKVAA